MNSPPNPGSPSSSATSLSDRESDDHFAPSASAIAASAGAPTSSASTSAKRRLGPSTPTKSRKLDRERQHRGVGGASILTGGDAAGSGASAAARAKEELVDQHVLEQFKTDFGDPFDDAVLEKSA